jgi:hypothetical protein
MERQSDGSGIDYAKALAISNTTPLTKKGAIYSSNWLKFMLGDERIKYFMKSWGRFTSK